MGAMINAVEGVLNLFAASQETAACHQKNSLLLRKIYQKSSLDRFWQALSPPINLILEIDFKQKNPYVDRIIEFIGIFAAALIRLKSEADESFDEEPLISRLFEHLLQASSCASDIIRFRSCQLINKILDHLAGSEISDELCCNMQDVLMERLSDSKSVIKLQAIVALYRLQDPSDPEDPLISEFIQLMHDSQAKVRRLCVERIACRRDVIEYIVKRTRDIDVNVRLAAYKKLSKFAKSLKITDRRTVLFTGIFDKSDKVKEYVFTEFLSSWWDTYDSDIIALMKSMRLDADENDIATTTELYENVLNKFYFKTRTLKELLEVLPLTEERLVPYKELNWETITYWRLLIALLAKNEDLESHLETVAPELVFFCRYVKGYSEYSKTNTDESYLEKQYIIRQFFQIIRISDLADTHSIRTVHALVEFLLKKEDLMDDTVEAIIGILEQTIPDAEHRCRFGMEIISDILYPVDTEEEVRKEQDKEFQLSKLKVLLATLQEDQSIAVKTADYIEAERLKHMIGDVSFQVNNLKNEIFAPAQQDLKKRNDLPTTCKCLDIAWAILRCANVSRLTPTLKSLKNDFLPELLVHESEIVRLKALRCYAICCIFDKATAQQGIHIFAVPISAYQAGEECDTQTLITCISAVSDLLRIYGADLMAEPHEDQLSDSVNEEHQKVFSGGTSLTSLVQGLVDLMDNEQYDIQLKASEGLCKLVLDERIHSPPLISRLILKWCQPIDKDESESQSIKQFIGHVLEKLPRLPCGSQQLEGAVLLTINTLTNAPRNSPLADVDLDNISKFMLALCKLSNKGQNIHSNIALALCSKINQNPDNKINSTYSKLLLLLDLPDDKSIIEEIFALADEAREYVGEKLALKNLTKFLSILIELLKDDKDMSVKVTEHLPNLTEEDEDEDMVLNGDEEMPVKAGEQPPDLIEDDEDEDME